MKLEANIGDVQSVIDFRDEGQRVFAEIDGRSYQLEVQELAAGRYTLMAEGLVFECRVEGTPESGNTVEVFAGHRQFPIAIIDPKRLRSGATASAQADGAARIIAPMPGKVVRVLVEAGAQVASGDGVVVVEAMKMQNEMKAPKAGTVSSLKVEQGATVNAGDVLAIIE
ncbi:MAG TPA: biotin/lipoyl-containing protein [Pyrinomonadaceae bacterium]